MDFALSELPTLSDDRVVLRPFEAGDAGVLAEIWRDPEIRARNTVPEPTPEAALEWIGQTWARAAEGQSWEWAVTDVSSGVLVGRRALKAFNRDFRCASAAAWIDPRHRGRRFAPRSLRLAASFAFSHGAIRVQAHCEADNLASIASVRASGMTHEGTLRSYFITIDGKSIVDAEVFSLIPGDL